MSKINNLKKQNIYSSEFITSLLKEVAKSNDMVWRESFFKWEDRSLSFDSDFSTSLAILISFKKKKKIEDVLWEIKEKFLDFEDKINIYLSSKGYVNFVFDDRFYKDFAFSFLEGSFFSFRYPKKKTINIEFVSVNPTGYLHLGHLRNAVIGNAISNLYKFIGFDVVKEYYINDRGEQIEKLVRSVIFRCKKILKIKNINNENVDYKGKDIEDVSFYILKIKKISLDDFDSRKEDIRNIIVNFFIEKNKLDLKKFGINFDIWFSEKEMYSDSKKVENILNFFSKKNLSYEKEKAIFLRTSIFLDEKDRVIIKDNGDFTYFFSDILYHFDKISRSDIVIDVWGSDHHGYINRLKSSLKILGFENVENIISIVLIQMVSLVTSEGNKKFSKRLGTKISVEDSEKWIKRDQLKFCLLETDCNNHLSINTEILNEENSKSKLYYIQYAFSRCNKILEKWNAENPSSCLNETENLLSFNQKEKELLKELLNFETIVLKSTYEKKPHLLTKYLYSLSSIFHAYYQSFPILDHNSKFSNQRVILVFMVEKTISLGLEIFSVEKKIEI